MIKFRTSLHMFFGRLRYRLAKIRKSILNNTILHAGHWKWVGWTILMIMGLFMAGMALEFVGKMHVGIYLLAILFYLGLALLAGLGVKLGVRVVNLLPEKQSWIFFGAFFFVLSLFGFPGKAQLVLALFIILPGSFLGAGIYNISGGRWKALPGVRKVLTIVFTILGTGLFVFGTFYILYPGKAAEEVKAWSMESTILPDQIGVDNPSQAGPHQIDSLSYGWGKDKPRKDFGSGVDLRTEAVDGSSFLDGWDKLSGKLRSHFWKMGPDSLALNGLVWYPLGEGPFPLVLMVHGNHLDRDYSDTGYGYLGRHFASHGIIAVSVDENFLNGAWSDFISGLKTETDCRAWLLLKHLEQWREWNACDTVLFHNKVDLDQVVLIGHSRGGEAVSVATCFNRLPFYPDNARERFDFNFNIRGIAAIAPVDGQYSPGGIPTPVENVNYFTIQGSMDADLRSYDGLRQMLRVQFKDSVYHFASGLYLHGANHGQFNQSWGIFDNPFPNYLLLNRKAIIPVEQQEQVALVYLSAFVLESFQPGSGYLPLFKDYRSGRHWLPDLVHLNQFHESRAIILCDFEEDLDLSTGSRGVDSITSSGLALWKEGRIPKKWGDYRNNAVFLGWNNEEDSIPGDYLIVLDASMRDQVEGARALTFLAADAQIDPGEREKEDVEGSKNTDQDAENTKEDSEKKSKRSKRSKKKDDDNGGAEDSEGSEKSGDAEDSEGSEKSGDAEDSEDSEKSGDEDPVPVDFMLVLTDTLGMEYRVRLGEFQMLQPAIKPQLFKSRLFWEDAESEVIQQYVSLPLEFISSSEGSPVSAGAIHSMRFIFDAKEKGCVLLDQLGFAW